ncbi:MAG TPA: pitrilysin family protein, partial [Gammaproteobacteria bacterium]|nr:pitrilysin family protein [Gammaproteobacteria bacterium]
SSGNGTRQSIQWMTRQDMVDYKEATITAVNSTIVVIGDTTLEELLPMLESKFGSWNSEASQATDMNYEVTVQSNARKIYLFDKPEAMQSLIVAGQLLPANGTDDEVDIDLMNRVIGGSFTSRLNMNLREDKSWSYGVRARLSSRKGPRPMLVYAPVQTDRTVDSIKEIQKEYSEYLSSRPATNAELDPIKQQIILGLNGQFETFGSLLSGVSGIVTFDRGDDYLNAVPEKYNAVTIGQVNAAAKKYMDPETWTWFIVGDLSKIEEDIRNLGLGEVEIIVLD